MICDSEFLRRSSISFTLTAFLLIPALQLASITQKVSAAPTNVLTRKWTAVNTPGRGEGLVISDVNNDGVQEIRARYGTALSLNRWYSVALTFKDGEGIKLYVDGRQVASASQSGFVQRSVQPVCIGWFDYFRGRIDEVKIYPVRLKSGQISQNYIASQISSMLASESANQSPETIQSENVSNSIKTSQVAPEPSLMLLYTDLDSFKFSMFVLTSKSVKRSYPL